MSRTRSIAFASIAASLALSACATIEETVAENTGETYRATLTDAQEVGGGDPDGTGQAEITISDSLDQVCWDVNNVTNVSTITAAHIHLSRSAENPSSPFRMSAL